MKLKSFLFLIIVLVLSTLLFGQANRSAIIKEFTVSNDDSAFITKHSIMPYQKYSLQRTLSINDFSPLDSLIFLMES